MSDSELKQFDEYLLEHAYVSGFTPSQDDIFKFLQIKLVPQGLKNVQRWWRNISSYESEFETLPGEPKRPQLANQGISIIYKN